MTRPMTFGRIRPDMTVGAGDARGATSPFSRLMIRAVTLISPHDEARDPVRERDKLCSAVIAALPADWRSVIRSVGCDRTECCIELTAPCSLEAAQGIGLALQQALKVDVSINGLCLCDVDARAFGYPWTTTAETIAYWAKVIGGPPKAHGGREGMNR